MSVIRTLCVLAALAVSTSTHATTVSYFLNQSNSTALPDGTNYLQVTIDDTGGNINFHVETLAPLNSIAGSNYGIDMFGFNTTQTLSAANIAFASGTPSSWGYDGTKNLNGFGNYTARLSGNGSSRLSVLDFSIVGITGDTISDYIKLSTGATTEGNQYFAAHVAGITVPGSTTTSAYFGGTTPVPLPAAAWLLGSGLIGLFGIARRKAS